MAGKTGLPKASRFLIPNRTGYWTWPQQSCTGHYWRRKGDIKRFRRINFLKAKSVMLSTFLKLMLSHA
jgi:hypothetical protein